MPVGKFPNETIKLELWNCLFICFALFYISSLEIVSSSSLLIFKLGYLLDCYWLIKSMYSDHYPLLLKTCKYFLTFSSVPFQFFRLRFI